MVFVSAVRADGIGIRVPGGTRIDQTVTDVDRALAELQADPAIRSLLKRESGHQFNVSGMAEGSGVSTTKFKHTYQGIEVIGSQAFHHHDSQGVEIRSMVNDFNISTVPRLTAKDALTTAISYFGGNLEDGALKKAPALKILPSRIDDSAKLVWVIETQDSIVAPGAEITLDATSGELISHYSKHLDIASVRVFTAANQGLVVNLKSQPSPLLPNMPSGCDLKNLATGEIRKDLDVMSCNVALRDACQALDATGSILRLTPLKCREIARDMQASPEALQDPAAKNAWQNAVQTLQYFQDKHRRNSFDNRGTPIVSVIHVGAKMSNAFWSSDLKYMAYGEGDGQRFKDFSVAVDVAGHEMTHGVVQATANLSRGGEPASLNEAYADFFGKMVENKGNWVIGEDLTVVKVPGQGIRNLENPGLLKARIPNAAGQPTQVPYPSKASEMAPTSGQCTRENDFCWAHFNATVPGHTSFLISRAIGTARTEVMYYLALSQFLNSTATFNDSALATLAACQRLYDSATCGQVQAIFLETGMLRSGQRGVLANGQPSSGLPRRM